MTDYFSERRKDAEEARNLKRQATEARKRAALRVLDAGGGLEEAAKVAKADERTVKRWLKESKV